MRIRCVAQNLKREVLSSQVDFLPLMVMFLFSGVVITVADSDHYVAAYSLKQLSS